MRAVVTERTPVRLVVPAVLAIGFLALPIVTFFAGVPWLELPTRLAAPDLRDALRLSLLTSTAATALCAVLGLPLAWLLSRTDAPGRSLIRSLVVLPLVLPPVAGGLALMSLLGPDGVIGRPLAAVGLGVQGSTVAVILAQAFVGLPFLVLAAEGALRGVDREFAEITQTLGGRRWDVFRYVSIPMAAPGIIAGLVLAWARALGEFGATATFAGKVPGVTETLPLALYRALETDVDSAITVGLVLVTFSAAVVLSLRSRWMESL
jgi:molybdate transport system permease protein